MSSRLENLLVRQVNEFYTKFPGRHQNIVRLHQYLECDDFHYLIFEYVKAADMFCFLEKRNFSPMPENDAR